MDHRVRVKKVSFSDSDSCHDGDSDLESRLLSADDSILRQAHYKMLYRDDWEFGVFGIPSENRLPKVHFSEQI